MTASRRSAYRYGDFPELFWDAQPGAPIDPANPVVLARILSRGSSRAMSALLTLELIRDNLGHLALPGHVLAFWRRVVELPDEYPDEPRSSSLPASDPPTRDLQRYDG